MSVIDRAVLERNIPLYGALVDETLAVYQVTHQEATHGEFVSAIMTDLHFRMPAICLAEAQIRTTSGAAYLYEFAWQSPAYNGRIGASHLMEIPFVFDNLHIRDMERLLGSEPPQQIADVMHAVRVAFAQKGDPGWPRYDLEHRATMRFDIVSEVVDDPRAAERLFWEGRR